MAGNATAIFTKAGVIWPALILPAVTANTKSDGTGTIGTDMILLGTAGVDGALIDYIEVALCASVAATTTTASVLRLYVSSQAAGATTNANTHWLGDINLPATAVDNTTTGVPMAGVLALNKVIPTGFSLLASIHAVPAANTSVKAVAWGGTY